MDHLVNAEHLALMLNHALSLAESESVLLRDAREGAARALHAVRGIPEPGATRPEPDREPAVLKGVWSPEATLFRLLPSRFTATQAYDIAISRKIFNTKSTVWRHLGLMSERGWLEREGSRVYRKAV